MKFLLSVIAVCLVMITAKLYIPEVEAEVAGMNSYELQYDNDFSDAVEAIAIKTIQACGFYGNIDYTDVHITVNCY